MTRGVCCLAQVYLRGLPRQLSSEELRAERVGFQVHPQPWFRSADDRTPVVQNGACPGWPQQPTSACPASLRDQGVPTAPDRSLGPHRSHRRTSARLRARSRVLTLDQCCVRPALHRALEARGLTLTLTLVLTLTLTLTHPVERRPLTRSNESLGRGTASSMRREMSGDSSARAE